MFHRTKIDSKQKEIMPMATRSMLSDFGDVNEYFFLGLKITSILYSTLGII